MVMFVPTMFCGAESVLLLSWPRNGAKAEHDGGQPQQEHHFHPSKQNKCGTKRPCSLNWVAWPLCSDSCNSRTRGLSQPDLMVSWVYLSVSVFSTEANTPLRCSQQQLSTTRRVMHKAPPRIDPFHFLGIIATCVHHVTGPQESCTKHGKDFCEMMSHRLLAWRRYCNALTCIVAQTNGALFHNRL